MESLKPEALRRDSVSFAGSRQYAEWLLAIIALIGAAITYTRAEPLRLESALLGSHTAGLYAPEMLDGRTAAFTDGAVQIRLPSQTRGRARVILDLRTPAGIPRRDAYIGFVDGDMAMIPIDDRWRRYYLLLEGGNTLLIRSDATTFASDSRRIGLVLARVAIEPVGLRVPFAADMVLLSGIVLLMGALAYRVSVSLPLGVAVAALALAQPWLSRDEYGAFLAFAVAVALHGSLSAIRWHDRASASHKQLVWRALALIAGVGGCLGLALSSSVAQTLVLSVQITGAVAATLALLLLPGFPLTWLLHSWRLAPAMFLLAPLLGLAGIMVVGHLLAWLPTGTSTTSWLILLISSGLSVWAWRRGMRPSLRRAHLPALAVGGIACILALLPVFQIGYLTTIGGTIDAVSYVNRARYLQAHGMLTRPDDTSTYPLYQMITTGIDTGFRQGDAYVLAFLSSVTGAPPHLLLPVLMATGYALTSVAIVCLAWYEFRLSREAAVIAGLLTAVQPLLHWSLLDGFLSQTLGTALCPPLLLALSAALRGVRRAIIVAGLLVMALAAVYPVYLPYMMGIAGLTTLLRLIRAKPGTLAPAILRLARRGIGVVVVALLAAPVAWILALRQYRDANQGITATAIAEGYLGNIRVFPHPAEIIGLSNHAEGAYRLGLLQTPDWLATFGLGLALLLIVYGAVRGRWSGRTMQTAVLLTFGAGLWQQRFWFLDGAGYPYGYFKVAALATPFAVVALCYGTACLYRDASLQRSGLRDLLRTMLMTGGSALAVLGLYFLISTSALAARDLTVANRQILALTDAARLIPEGEPVALLDRRHPHRSWTVYLLNRPVYDLAPADPYPARPVEAAAAPPQYALIAEPQNARNIPILDAWLRSGATIRWQNERYVLLQRVR